MFVPVSAQARPLEVVVEVDRATEFRRPESDLVGDTIGEYLFVRVLKEKTHPADEIGERGPLDSGDRSVALPRGPQQSAQHLQERRLAAAVGAGQCHDLARIGGGTRPALRPALVRDRQTRSPRHQPASASWLQGTGVSAWRGGTLPGKEPLEMILPASIVTTRSTNPSSPSKRCSVIRIVCPCSVQLTQGSQQLGSAVFDPGRSSARQQQDLGAHRQGPGNRQSLFLAAREREHLLPSQCGEGQSAEGPFHARRVSSGGKPRFSQPKATSSSTRSMNSCSSGF